MSQLGLQKLIHGFRLQRSFEVPEFRLLAAELIHEKTKAKYWHLRRDDSNKTFSVQFRTTPQNDSGISHILEHTVLCGSVKYPVRDPFFKMLRRSQANFMNALTANDWTMYPFSTLNSVDFKNLFAVYSDAVFSPKLSEHDFMQEGWRLEPKEISDSASPLLIKGVVFNEMKGVFSNSLNRFAQTVQNRLLPQTYPFVSGGHPDSIPTLTWEVLKEFHRSCYHPSNACFYTYGDADLEWCLEFLDKEYLKHYDAIELNNEVSLEPAWDAHRTVDLTCEPDPMAADPDRQCVCCLSYRLDDIRSVYTNFVLGLVSKLLLDGDNAPFYRGLIESGFGLDWASGACGFDQGARTTTFHVGVQGVRSADVSQFTQVVSDILHTVIREGFPPERVESVLHQYELAVRHESARFGLNLIFALAHLTNHNADVAESLHVQNLIKQFHHDFQADPHMLQNVVQRFMVDNKHVLLTTMKPDEHWQLDQSKHDAALQQQLVDSVSASERNRWIAKSRELFERQQMEEDVSCLPCLRLLDIPPECYPEPFTIVEVNGCSLQLNEAPTNGIVYFHALVDLKTLPQELLIYIPLFCELFPRLGADGLTYSEMDAAIDLHTGGLNGSAHVAPILPSDCGAELGASLNVHLFGHCLVGKVPNFFDLWSKLFRAPTWSDTQRLMTLILMSTSGDWSANAIADSAHRFAMCRAAANLSVACRVNELWSGLEQAMMMKNLSNNLGKSSDVADSTLHELVERMISIWQHISDPSRLRFSLHGESEGLSSGMRCLEQFVSSIPRPNRETASSPAVLSIRSMTQLPSHSYFVMPYTVHYTGLALPAPAYDSPNYASFCVLSQLLVWKFLHREIREKGGAYGGRALVKPEALLFFSYRDPHARQTLDTFRQSLKWAQSTEFTTQAINEAKLSVFQELDQPVSAGSRGLTHFLQGIDDQRRQWQRNNVFAVDTDNLRTAADQLLSHQVGAGCSVLGPDDSCDWPTEVPPDEPVWERVVMQE